MLGAALLGLGCGKSSSSSSSGSSGSGAGANAGVDAGAGDAGTSAKGGDAGTNNQGGYAGMSCGPGCFPGGTGGTGVPVDTEENKACRGYFSAVCARVRECGIKNWGPCESPIDVCPDSLFSKGSAWTSEAVTACTEAWKTHDCAALTKLQGPTCSQVPGTRPLGEPCSFAAQCQSGICSGGVAVGFVAQCGVCAELSTLDGTCDEQNICPAPNNCVAGACTGRGPQLDQKCIGIECDAGLRCEAGFCVARKPLDSVCTDNGQCALDLGCQIELVAAPEPEPTTGTCKPLPAIGGACLPTFGHVGACPSGASCDNRPSGKCVALAQIGQACGYAKCVTGAYCPITGYQSVPPHVCHALAAEGADCPHEETDLGYSACAGDISCLCGEPNCKTGKCAKPRYAKESCNSASQRCNEGLVCVNGSCVDPTDETGVTAAGSPCLRYSTFARETSSCQAGLECLCPDTACTTPICATPRLAGEICDTKTQLCRQGLTCTPGGCTEVVTRGIDALACGVK